MIAFVIRRWIESQKRHLYASIDIDWKDPSSTMNSFKTIEEAIEFKQEVIWEEDATIVTMEIPDEWHPARFPNQKTPPLKVRFLRDGIHKDPPSLEERREALITALAQLLLEQLKQECVDAAPTPDDENYDPPTVAGQLENLEETYQNGERDIMDYTKDIFFEASRLLDQKGGDL